MPKSKSAPQAEARAPQPRGNGETSPPANQAPEESKLEKIITLLRCPNGATIEELMTATSWQAHSVRGAIAGAVKKKVGVAVQSVKEGDVRVYRLGTV